MRLLAIATLIALVTPGFPSANAQASLRGRAHLVDGDTFDLGAERIRPNGYDTPEEGKRCGGVDVYKRSTEALANFVGQNVMVCESEGERDSRGRLIAICSVEDKDVGEFMVQQGWGRDWPRYSKKKYADEEAAARAAKRGIWGMSCPEDLWSGRNYQ